MILQEINKFRKEKSISIKKSKGICKNRGFSLNKSIQI